MSTESCGRCGTPAPEALLRNVSLHVDGSEVDAQTICPDCFSDWIAHYQEQMAGDMPGSDESRAESDETGDATGDDPIDDDALSEAVRAAQQHIESQERQGATPPGRQREERVESVGGDEIREVEAGSATDGGVNEEQRPSSASEGHCPSGNRKPAASGDNQKSKDGVDVDLGGKADVAEDEEEDGGGLLPG